MVDVESIIKTAAFKAACLNDDGDSIKGILLHEDVFYELMKKEPKFKGVIEVTTQKGRNSKI